MNNNKNKMSTSLTIAINLLIQNKQINTFEFRNKGVCSPSGAISRLKQLGAIIDIERKVAKDNFGQSHSNISHYTLKGWK
jgi:hypothetical protein